MPHKVLEEKLLRLLSEDLGQGDITTGLIIPVGTMVEAEMMAKEPGVVAGIEEAEVLLKSLGVRIETLVKDGGKVKIGQKMIRISGDARTILSAERTVLNLLSRMSGIATTTRSLVEKLQKAKLKVTVACTRKTAPGLMYFDKKAVLIGGGDTHRLHLDDMILIKDNHIAVAGGIEKTIGKARRATSFTKRIEAEVTSAEDAVRAAKAGADIIMLDNFSPNQARKTCASLKKTERRSEILIEASGGITAENIMEYASTGVDIVSLGEITQSPKALDISLKTTNICKE